MLVDVALEYLRSGLCVLPARLADKRPALSSWKAFQKSLPTEQQVREWFKDADALCLLCGEVSGHLEMIDFDQKGELFDTWLDAVCSVAPDLLDRLVIESTQNGGSHVIYRSSEPVCGNIRLAERTVPTQTGDEITIHGKKYRPHRSGDKWEVTLTLIETRGSGGLFLCAPSPGYELKLGSFDKITTVTPEERDLLLSAAYALNERLPQPEPITVTGSESAGRPGDEFNQRGNIREYLVKHGWTMSRAGENEHWSRPGKSRGTSATLKGGVFYVFSSNAAPFEQNKAYSPFGAFALFEHAGDFRKAASALRSQGFGKAESNDVDLSKIQSPLTPPGLPHQLGLPKSYEELVANHPTLRPPVIHGLLREGETMNVISAPKIGKSWLVTDLALSLTTGRPWLGMPCERGDVLILDNELHGETSAHRIPKVADARKIDDVEINKRLFVHNLRGQLTDLFSLGAYFRQFQPGRFRAVILDAFYRFIPKACDENDNGTMANLYNCIDSYADHLKCCFILIHHSSKGNQSAKDVTDVGAGAGAQSRATDTHLVLRRHENDDVVVLDAAVRSWPPINARCLRWSFPVWHPEESLDPNQLRQEGKKRTSPEPEATTWTPEAFKVEFVTAEGRSEARIYEDAEAAELSTRRTKRLIELALEAGLIYKIKMSHGLLGYSTCAPPSSEADPVGLATKSDHVRSILAAEPNLPTNVIVERTGADDSLVRRLRRGKESKAHESHDQEQAGQPPGQ